MCTHCAGLRHALWTLCCARLTCTGSRCGAGAHAVVLHAHAPSHILLVERACYPRAGEGGGGAELRHDSWHANGLHLRVRSHSRSPPPNPWAKADPTTHCVLRALGPAEGGCAGAVPRGAQELAKGAQRVCAGRPLPGEVSLAALTSPPSLAPPGGGQCRCPAAGVRRHAVVRV